mmetsp:Transcript_8102/g.20731  ORF Transcript_8102/g.20731 Transcript_8102/m.20731 type:complete len:295 (-) Transcript_8102:237-1121(-)
MQLVRLISNSTSMPVPKMVISKPTPMVPVRRYFFISNARILTFPIAFFIPFLIPRLNADFFAVSSGVVGSSSKSPSSAASAGFLLNLTSLGRPSSPASKSSSSSSESTPVGASSAWPSASAAAAAAPPSPGLISISPSPSSCSISSPIDTDSPSRLPLTVTPPENPNDRIVDLADARVPATRVPSFFMTPPSTALRRSMAARWSSEWSFESVMCASSVFLHLDTISAESAVRCHSLSLIPHLSRAVMRSTLPSPFLPALPVDTCVSLKTRKLPFSDTCSPSGETATKYRIIPSE